MNIKKIAAGFLAASVGTVALAASASAYTAEIKFADGSWGVNSMADLDLYEEYDFVTADVTGDGTYTVSYGGQVYDDGGDVSLAEGITVFCVDIEGLAAAKGAGKGAEGYDDLEKAADKMAFAKAAGLNVSDVKVTITDPDGKTTDIAVDQSKILFGDIEANGKLRIEIYNEYGDSKNDPAVNKDDVTNAAAIAVTFTVSGVSDNAAAGDNASDNNNSDNNTAGDVSQSTDDKNSPDTGVEGVAVIAGLAVIAAGAVVVAKKRK